MLGASGAKTSKTYYLALFQSQVTGIKSKVDIAKKKKKKKWDGDLLAHRSNYLQAWLHPETQMMALGLDLSPSLSLSLVFCVSQARWISEAPVSLANPEQAEGRLLIGLA